MSILQQKLENLWINEIYSVFYRTFTLCVNVIHFVHLYTIMIFFNKYVVELGDFILMFPQEKMTKDGPCT